MAGVLCAEEVILTECAEQSLMMLMKTAAEMYET